MNYLFSEPVTLGGAFGLSFPVGIAYVAAVVRAQGERAVFGFNPRFWESPMTELKNEIIDKMIDVICIGLFGFSVLDPQSLNNNSADYILVSSIRYGGEIIKTIQDELCLSIPIIGL